MTTVRLLTTDEAAALVGVKSATLRKWVERGKLAPVFHAPDGRPLYLEGDVYDAEHRAKKGRSRRNRETF